MIRTFTFLPGVPHELVLAAAGGNEIDSGNPASPQSSAARAVNALGWFLHQPSRLPLFPVLGDLDWPALRVDIEREMRFPWDGGRHPWLDAAVETTDHPIAIGSKRLEPFRDTKIVSLSPAYDRVKWDPSMKPFTAMRDVLHSVQATFDHLDATQLVKHASGLVTKARRHGKSPLLLYLFAEPAVRWLFSIAPAAHARHRAEIAGFAEAVAGAEEQALVGRLCVTAGGQQ